MKIVESKKDETYIINFSCKHEKRLFQFPSCDLEDNIQMDRNLGV
jgi:hypothetical protein